MIGSRKAAGGSHIEKMLLDRFPAVYPSDWSLDGVRRALAALGNPQNRYPVVHVAGTSGKSSVCALVRNGLVRAGARTGLTLSPHLFSVRERFQIGTGPIDEERFALHVASFLDRLHQLDDLTLPFFDAMVALAFWIFAEERVDCAVVEVGLGGRLDATNTISRSDKVCVVSAIGMDHQDILGGTVEAIAAEKAGIAMPGAVFLYIDQDDRAANVLHKVALAAGAQPKRVLVSTTDRSPGRYSARNEALAEAALDAMLRRLGLHRTADHSSASLEGRYQYVDWDGRKLLVDGAHNPQEISALHDRILAEKVAVSGVVLAVSTGPGDKATQMLHEVLAISPNVVVTSFRPKVGGAKRAQDLESRATVDGGAPGHRVTETWQEAVRLLPHNDDSTVVVTGSLYLVADVLEGVGRY